ncbi:hypothetical protein [Bradyrhizobium sp. ORS 375]|uniref:hypothetical protein n=1 Tax=Bradyrhizobium sp. (strain ORS 375) TaxID=566679 RepID=UPI001584EA39|nr:hypothetical protein [Bradyrhizobium sp. ORS 375]
MHRSFMAPFESVTERARATGDIVAGLVGPLFFRRWSSHEPDDARFVPAIAHNALE